MGRAPNFCRMLLVASTALASTIGASCGGDSSPVSADSADLEAALPDLDDVPNGYQVGDKSGCGALGLEGATPVIEGLLEGTFPEGVAVCRRDLTWAWREAGSNPAGLSVSLFSWPDDEIAARGLNASPDLSQWLSGLPLTPGGLSPGIGEESLALEGRDAGSRPGVPVAAVAWRDGA